MTGIHEDDPDPSRAPILTHLIELRQRLLLCLVFFSIVFCAAYYFVADIYAFLMRPLALAFDHPEQRRMIYTGLHEAFFTYLKLAFYTALFFSIPLILLQIWKFIAPGLYRHERASMLPAFLLTPFLFLLGAALAFYVIMPLAWEFFLGFETTNPDTGVAVQLEARVSEYLGLVIQLILAFGISFELPVLLLVLARIGLVNADTLREHRRHMIVLTFLVAAFITPPDLLSQIALAMPVLLLYELSILIIRWTQSNPRDLAGQKAT
jgi:sec-independent protein translocase protein TatC